MSSSTNTYTQTPSTCERLSLLELREKLNSTQNPHLVYFHNSQQGDTCPNSLPKFLHPKFDRSIYHIIIRNGFSLGMETEVTYADDYAMRLLGECVKSYIMGSGANTRLKRDGKFARSCLKSGLERWATHDYSSLPHFVHPVEQGVLQMVPGVEVMPIFVDLHPSEQSANNPVTKFTITMMNDSVGVTTEDIENYFREKRRETGGGESSSSS